MTGILIAFFGLALLGLALFLARRADYKAGYVLRVREFPDHWTEILERRFAIYPHLPDSLREDLHQRLLGFVNRKRFEACGSLAEVTEEMRVLVAAQACLLLIGRPREKLFPRLKSILLYPGAFRDRGRRTFGLDAGDGDERVIRLGESWTTGSVILAWDSVKRGAANDHDGMNVVLHEFAHQLDQADGIGDGVPTLDAVGDYQDWEEIMKREYEELVEDANNPRARPLMDTYGAENPAEFFAVATETFFEMPEDLSEEHPELYGELRDYYGVDPVSWLPK